MHVCSFVVLSLHVFGVCGGVLWGLAHRDTKRIVFSFGLFLVRTLANIFWAVYFDQGFFEVFRKL